MSSGDMNAETVGSSGSASFKLEPSVESGTRRGLAGAGGVLFLDFDGVLNSCNWYRARTRPPNPTEEEHHLNELDPHAVAQLDRIIRETGCSVVISSTWRRGNSVGYLLRILVKRGLSKDHWDNFIGKTPVLDGRLPSGLYTAPERGHEIQAWLDSWPEKFARVVILDDDADMGHLLPKLVGCNGNEGLTAEKAVIVIARLKCEAGGGGGFSSDNPSTAEKGHNGEVSDGGPLASNSQQDVNPPFTALNG